MYNHCAINSDENILLLQFQNSNRYFTDTFMLIVPGLVHYETHYIVNIFDDSSFIALMVPRRNPEFNPLLVNNSAHILNWKRIELNEVIYYYTTLSLSVGTHTLAFVGNFIMFEATIYGSGINNMYALPAGMRLNLITHFPIQG